MKESKGEPLFSSDEEGLGIDLSKRGSSVVYLDGTPECMATDILIRGGVEL